MATQRSDTHEHHAPPNIEERWSVAINTSDLGFNPLRQGSAFVLTASGLASQPANTKAPRYIDQPSANFGWQLARLQSEWHSAEKPIRHQARSIRQWVEILPLKQIGERDGKPLYTRDKEGARGEHEAERQRLEALYTQELKFLAQKLPTRIKVRERLYSVALHWEWDEPETMVSAVLNHWLDDNCHNCDGTGEVMVGEKVQTCGVCSGRKKSQVPYSYAGRRMQALMEESKQLWVQSVKRQMGMMRGRGDKR